MVTLAHTRICMFIIFLIQIFYAYFKEENIQSQPVSDCLGNVSLLTGHPVTSPEYLALTQACVNRHFAQAGGIF